MTARLLECLNQAAFQVVNSHVLSIGSLDHNATVADINHWQGRLRSIIDGITIFLDIVLKTIVVLLGAPYYFFCGVVGSIKWIPIVYILRGVKDDAFYNTARYGARLGLAIPALIIWSLVYQD